LRLSKADSYRIRVCSAIRAADRKYVSGLSSSAPRLLGRKRNFLLRSCRDLTRILKVRCPSIDFEAGLLNEMAKSVVSIIQFDSRHDGPVAMSLNHFNIGEHRIMACATVRRIIMNFSRYCHQNNRSRQAFRLIRTS
jgi:hypothetical protein